MDDRYHQHLDHLHQQHHHFHYQHLHLQIILYGSQIQILMRQKEEIKNVIQKEHDDKIYELANDPLGDER